MFSNLDKMVRHMDIAQAQMAEMNFLLLAILFVLCGILASESTIVVPIVYRRWRQSKYPKTLAIAFSLALLGLSYVFRSELLVAAWMLWNKIG